MSGERESWADCPACGGSGGDEWMTGLCRLCHGRGQVQARILGDRPSENTTKPTTGRMCWRCLGDGVVRDHLAPLAEREVRCRECQGKGVAA